MRDIINQTYNRDGKVIIPAFSVGRTQYIVYVLHQLLADQQIPQCPVYVDSPLSVNATEIFLLHPECYDEETRRFLMDTGSQNPFSFAGMSYVRDVEDSKAINGLRGPAIIISASGMCETGRILHHLKNNIEDSRNTIIIVGWQAPYTLGRRLVEKQERVRILGEEYVRRADVQTLNAFSAHADRDELIGWFTAVQNPHLQHTFVVHGEASAPTALAAAMREHRAPHVTVPELGQRVEL